MNEGTMAAITHIRRGVVSLTTNQVTQGRLLLASRYHRFCIGSTYHPHHGHHDISDVKELVGIATAMAVAVKEFAADVAMKKSVFSYFPTRR